MFEIGDYYWITYGTHDNYTNTYGKCIDWAHPLLKFQEAGKDEVVINTSNSSFLRAEVAPEPSERPVFSGNMGSAADFIKDE
ncbi:hypothetical protein [Agrobacterium fabrum]|uniref:hypothetical protein n=1 Tax=Agrobacterium fabrum TaxID=1176649 RepID=UPI001E5F1611|nr:hypothetical protein [Agrobacterium fabrum]